MHLIYLATISYLALVLVPPRWIHLTVLTIAMGYLSSLHIDRLVNDYTAYTVDITA